MRECKDKCISFERIRFGFGGKIYKNNVKFCKTCHIFLRTKGYKCTCCSGQIRSKSHSRKCRV
jgi:hypothetical protein